MRLILTQDQSEQIGPLWEKAVVSLKPSKLLGELRRATYPDDRLYIDLQIVARDVAEKMREAFVKATKEKPKHEPKPLETKAS